MASLNKLYSKKQIDEIRKKLIAEHGDTCGICQKPRSHFKNNLSVDHNHRTGRIRGLLCFRCNKFMLGRHSLESASDILSYLIKYDVPEETALVAYKSNLKK